MVFKNSYLNARTNPITHYSPWCIAIVTLKYFLIYIAIRETVKLIVMYNNIVMSGTYSYGQLLTSLFFVLVLGIGCTILGIDLYIFFKNLFIAYYAYFKLPILSIGYKQSKVFLSNFDTKEFEMGKVHIINNSYKGNGYYGVSDYFGFVLSHKEKVYSGHQWDQELIKGTFLNTFILYTSWVVSDWLVLLDELGEKTGLYCLKKKEKKEKFKKDSIENSQSSLEQLMKKIDEIKAQSQKELNEANDIMKNFTNK